MFGAVSAEHGRQNNDSPHPRFEFYSRPLRIPATNLWKYKRSIIAIYAFLENIILVDARYIYIEESGGILFHVVPRRIRTPL